MLTIVLRILTIFIIVIFGFLGAKAGKLPESSTKPLGFITVTIFVPCLSFSSIASQTLTPENLRPMAEVIFGSFIYYAFAVLISIPLLRLFKVHKTQPEDLSLMLVLCAAINTGFMGLPITQSIFGNHYLFFMVCQNFVGNLFNFVAAVFIMNAGTKDKDESFLKTLRPLFSFITLSFILGFAVLFSGFKVPEVFMDLTTMLGNATTPVSMLILGVQLAYSNLSDVFKNKNLTFVSIINLIIIPALLYLILYFLPLTNEGKLILMLSSTFPCAVIISTIAENEGKNSAFASLSTSLMTILSLITLPLWIALISNSFL